jgi:hypothetical protein
MFHRAVTASFEDKINIELRLEYCDKLEGATVEESLV